MECVFLSRSHIYGSEKGGGASQPLMMIILYDKYTALNPLWNVRNLGKWKSIH